MQFSKFLAGIAVLITGLTTPVLAGLISTPGSDLFEKRQQCEIKACGKDTDCNRHCTEGCYKGRCETSWVNYPCVRGCSINSIEEPEASA